MDWGVKKEVNAIYILLTHICTLTHDNGMGCKKVSTIENQADNGKTIPSASSVVLYVTTIKENIVTKLRWSYIFFWYASNP